MIFVLILLLRVHVLLPLHVSAHADPITDLITDIDAFVAKPIEVGEWSTSLQSRSLDGITNGDVPPGRLYGAVAWKIVDKPIARVREFFAVKGAIFRDVSAIKTQRDYVVLSETVDTLEIKLAIKVPVIRDYHTQDKLTLKDDKLEWRQSSSEGELTYNRGYVLVTADGVSSCRVLVVGVHLIREENRVPWIGRGAAARFAREHYAGYITALESVL